MYTAYIALVISFVLVIVLHAWFVRRLTSLREQARECKGEYHKLHAETVELVEAVGELDRGKDSNATSIQALKREIEDSKVNIRTFLTEHPELRTEFQAPEEAAVETEAEGEEEERAAAASDKA